MTTPKYDYLIVGSGLFGATFAHFAAKQGKKCLVIDKRSQLGGNVYCENIEGINVHKYGAHIFHTSNKKVWDFVNSIVEFNRYTNCPVANYKGQLFNLPFNMNTFSQMWGVKTPAEAQAKIDEQKAEAIKALNGREPQNLEEQALTLVGKDIFEKLIKEYTEKQWGRKCTELPAFIIKRLPVRLVFDNNYFNDKYQGIPVGGYNRLIEGLLGLSPSLPRREGEENTEAKAPIQNEVGIQQCTAHGVENMEAKAPLREGFGEAIDVLTGIDVPLCAPTRCLNHADGGYREMADPMNYGLLKENAKEMRKNPTEAESSFWSIVSDNNWGVKFRRQHVIGNYIVDFVCLEKKLIVELDGGYHDDSQQQIADNLRSKDLKEYGFTILRLRNEEVLGDTDALKEKLKLAMWLASLTPSIPHRGGEENVDTKAPLQEEVGRQLCTGHGVESPQVKAPLREGFREALVYTGPLDEYFGYCYGHLDWRTVSFKTRIEDMPNYQGNAVVNYTSHDEPYTRVIEHKHFEMFGQEVYDCPKTVISEEYSTEYKPGMEPYYPVNDERNDALAEEYRKLAHEQGIAFADEVTLLKKDGRQLCAGHGVDSTEIKAPLWEEVGGQLCAGHGVEDMEAKAPLREGFGEAIFGGRLALYKYYDMAPIIELVMKMFE